MDEQIPSFFSRLPLELQTRLLQSIINTGAGSLVPFLEAFPDLSHLVLLLSDHPDRPDQLIVIPGVDVVDFENHELISRLRPTKPITVLSFRSCDEEAAVGRLTRSPECVYGKYMDSKSAVFVHLRGKALFGSWYIEELGRLKGCVLEKSFIIEHDREDVSPNHVELDRTGNPNNIKRLIPRYLLGAVHFEDHPELPSVIGPPFDLKPFGFFCWQNITHFSAKNPLEICCGQRMPHVVTLRCFVPDIKCKDLRDRAGAESPKCGFPLYGLNYAYRVKKVHFEFRARRTPIIICQPYACSNIEAADRFSFINMDWSEADPTLSSAICEHAIEDGSDYLGWSKPSQQKPLTFLKIFREVTFVGIPDRVLLLSTFTQTRHITWKRLMPVNRAAVVDAQQSIDCPALETIHISTLLTRNDNKDPMPKINAPTMHSMDLCAVYGSNKVWDFLFHFSKETLASIKHLSMCFRLRADTAAITLLPVHLAPLSSSVESLCLSGCNPIFASLGPSDTGAIFWCIRLIELDIACLPYTGHPRPRVSVRLGRYDFPHLRTLKLTLASTEKGTSLCSGLADIRMQFSSSCQTLTVPKELTTTSFFVAREYSDRCEVVMLNNGEFHDRVHDPGYLSVSLGPGSVISSS